MPNQTITLKALVCVVARTASSRLPQKVLREFEGVPLVENIIHRIRPVLDMHTSLAICTTMLGEDDDLEKVGARNSIPVVRGSVLSVSDRMLKAADQLDAQILVRVTGDNLFTDPFYLRELIHQHRVQCAEYSRVEYLPAGVTAEAVNTETLRRCYQVQDPNKSEYMTIDLFRPDLFNTLVLIPEKKLQASLINLSIDTPEDAARTEQILAGCPDPRRLDSILSFIRSTDVPYAEISEHKEVRLFDQTLSYHQYRKQIDGLIAMSKKIAHQDGWYDQEAEKWEK